MGQIGILNVGAGDTKLTFDKNNPAECIRSARIIKDMLRRGYALLIEVADNKGNKSYTRVHEFREDTCEYIIADGPENTYNERNTEPAATPEHGTGDGETGEEIPKPKAPGKRGPKSRAIHASTTTGIAVSRSAGG